MTLPELRALLSRATPGPWRAGGPKGRAIAVYVDLCAVYIQTAYNEEAPETRDRWDADANLMAALRNAAPALLAVVMAAVEWKRATDAEYAAKSDVQADALWARSDEASTALAAAVRALVEEPS